MLSLVSLKAPLLTLAKKSSAKADLDSKEAKINKPNFFNITSSL